MKVKFFQNKKVTLVGLGILGGGTSMAKFILDQGGDLTITDLRTQELLQNEMGLVDKYASKLGKKVNYILESHTEDLFKNSDAVVFNPAVPYFSKWPQYCITNNIPLYNDFTLFQEYLHFKGTKSKQVWITGTRGKTTTTTYVHHLLGKDAIIGGNVLGSGLQKISQKKPRIFVLETSNYQLEYPILNNEIIQPEVSVITNIYVDHINRHKTFEEYRRVKNLIFSYNKDVILYLDKKEKSLEDIWKEKKVKNIKFIPKINIKNYSDNQLTALSFAIEIAKYFGVKESEIRKRIKTLPKPPMRQEVVLETKKWRIINDSTATSPDALIASIKSFKDAYFISGGTDADLDFGELTKTIEKNKLIRKGKIFFLEGTGTTKILNGLEAIIYNDLSKCLKDLKEKLEKEKGKQTIILSPGAKSFGLFKNEYDRGETFNKLVKKLFK